MRGVVAFGLDKIDPDKDIKITLIEAADRIVPALPKRLSDATARLLAELGVEVRTGARVTEVGPDGVHLAGGDFIPSELVVWAAGVRGPDVLKNLDGLEVSASGQLVVRPTLQTTRDDNIFAIGDCAYLVPDGENASDSAARPGGAPGSVAPRCGRSSAVWTASRSSRSSIATSDRWCRSASSRPSAA